MKKVLINTDVYCDAMRGKPYAVDIFQRTEQIMFSPVVTAELLTAFQQSPREQKNRRQLSEI